MIHLYWSGKILPYMRYLTLLTLCRHNPDKMVILYTGNQEMVRFNTNEQGYDVYANDYTHLLKELPIEIKDIATLPLPNKVLQYNAIHTSDILRWFVLSQYGGYWSDMDIYYLKPVPVYNTDVTICRQSTHSIGFLYGKQYNTYHTQMYNRCVNLDTEEYQGYGADILNKMKDSEIPCTYTNIPLTTVYPYSYNNMDKLYGGGILKIPDDTVGIHWYAGNNNAAKLINRLRHDNLHEYNGGIGRVVRYEERNYSR